MPPNDDPTDVSNIGVTLKTLPNVEEQRSVTPPIVTRVDCKLPLNTNTTLGIGGGAFVDTNGDYNYRVTIEGKLPQYHLDELKKLVRNNNVIRVISAGYTGNVNFDQFTYTRTADNDEITYQPERKVDTSKGFNVTTYGEITEPLYSFQLQNKQSDKNLGKSVLD